MGSLSEYRAAPALADLDGPASDLVPRRCPSFWLALEPAAVPGDLHRDELRRLSYRNPRTCEPQNTAKCRAIRRRLCSSRCRTARQLGITAFVLHSDLEDDEGSGVARALNDGTLDLLCAFDAETAETWRRHRVCSWTIRYATVASLRKYQRLEDVREDIPDPGGRPCTAMPGGYGTGGIWYLPISGQVRYGPPSIRRFRSDTFY
jgi:hypothetical protein